MELRQLKYFVAVAEELHFGRAAHRLHIATSPLSQQIKQLERDVGFPLFERSTRAVALTAGGKALLPRVRDVIREIDEAVAVAAKHQQGQAGSITVGYAGFSTSRILPEITRVFHDRFPEVTVSVRGESLSATQLDALRNFRLDIGFVRPVAEASDDRIRTQTLFHEEVVLAMPEDHRLAALREVSPDALAGEPFIRYEHCPTLAGAVHDISESSGFLPAVAEQAADTYSVVSMVAAGLGLAFVPAGIMSYGIGGVSFAHVSAEHRAQVPLSVAWRADSYKSPIIRNYLAVAAEVVAAQTQAIAPDTDTLVTV